jgi:hypothetical protein
MEELDMNTIIAIISSILALSELLPFVGKLQGNGIIHTFLLILKTGIGTLREKGIQTDAA